MHIRTIRTTDADELIALWRVARLKLPAIDLHAEIARKLERDADLFLAGEEAGCIVASVMGSYDGRRGWINRLAVHPNAQRRGLGRTLLAELERRLHGKGCQKLNLLIEPDNADVHYFYQQLGYQVDPLIFMEKWLG